MSAVDLQVKVVRCLIGGCRWRWASVDSDARARAADEHYLEVHWVPEPERWTSTCRWPGCSWRRSGADLDRIRAARLEHDQSHTPEAHP